MIRDKVVEHSMTRDIHEKLKNYLSQPVGLYVNKSSMRSNGVWATDAEIMGTASLLGIDVVVYSKYGDKMDWLTYSASFNNDIHSDTAVYMTNNNDHFNVVLSVFFRSFDTNTCFVRHLYLCCKKKRFTISGYPQNLKNKFPCIFLDFFL